MGIKAIVYTSNTGYTAEYAHLLGEKTSLPVYTLKQAENALSAGDAIIYLGWLMGGFIKGYDKAGKRYHVALVCGVCLGESGSQIEQVRKNNNLPAGLALYTLQGGFDMKRLKGVNKWMMLIMRKILIKEVEKKEHPTQAELLRVKMLKEGGSAVNETHLIPVLETLSTLK